MTTFTNTNRQLANKFCSECDGRGFKWQHGHIINRRTNEVIADTHTQGEACLKCYGTGYDDRVVISIKQILISAVCCLPVLLIFWFVLQF